MGKYSYNDNFFKVIDTEEKAYWLGFLYADGCITRFYRNEKIKSMSLELTLKESDTDHIIKFLKSLDSDVPIQNKKIKKYKASRVVINCTNMCRDLIKLGCTPKKSLTLTFPNEDILPKKMITHFIRGYFDGDGCVHYSEGNYYNKNRDRYYDQYTFVCSILGTEAFLNKLKGILFENGISSGEMYKKSGQEALEIRIYGKENIKKYFGYLYSDSTIYLERKYSKFKESFNKLNIDS